MSDRSINEHLREQAERTGLLEPDESFHWPGEDEDAPKSPKPASRGRVLLRALGLVVVLDVLAIAAWIVAGFVVGVALFIVLSLFLSRSLRSRLRAQSRKEKHDGK